MVAVKRSSFQVKTLPDDDPDLSWADDPEVVAALDVVGVVATVTVTLPKTGVVQDFTSPGVWNIATDWSRGDEEYFEQLGEEEKDVLQDILEELGVRVVP